MDGVNVAEEAKYLSTYPFPEHFLQRLMECLLDKLEDVGMCFFS